ncbi:MAG: dihydrolipoyl dehydrogenase [Treponemataceae bacterium]
MYDLVILGGGPGGYVSAIKAGRAGLKTLLVEKDKLGGTCLNRGCIPTKFFLHVSQNYYEARTSDFLSFDAPSYDMKKLYEGKNAAVDKLVSGVEALVKNAGVEIVFGEGKLESENSISVNGKTFEFKNLIIATGSKVFALPIPGIEKTLSSDDVLGREAVEFKSVIIVGGGVIGIEFATFYNQLGIDVTVVELERTILPPFDRDIGLQTALILKKRGVKIINRAKVVGLDKTSCTFELKGKEETITADAVIVCIGRVAQLDNIQLEKAGVEFDKRGIITDDFMRTNKSHIFAIGDAVKGNIMLAHNAESQGVLVVDNLLREADGKKTQPKDTLIPSCLYSTPEAASVGATENECTEKGMAVKVGKVPIGSNGKACVVGQEVGFIKVVFDEAETLIGCQMLCPAATDIIGPVGSLIKAKTSLTQILNTCYPHPTVAEAFKEACEDVHKNATHVMYRK